LGIQGKNRDPILLIHRFKGGAAGQFCWGKELYGPGSYLSPSLADIHVGDAPLTQ
jgi:hypothetical protein